MRLTLACLLMLGLAGICEAASFPVLDGQSRAVIVYDHRAKAEAVTAYQDLAAYLKRATGQEFPAVSDEGFDPAGKLPIYVGRCAPVDDVLRRRLRRLDRDAYLVIVEPGRVMLAGPNPWSTYWAVCQFLEDVVGVRWLIPGPLGEDVPHSDRIVAPVGEQVYSPAMKSRLWSGAHYGGNWSLRQRIHARDNFHHNLINVFDVNKYWASHPEYFPLHGSERYKPGKDDHAWQPCMGIDVTVQVAADTARAAFKANPDQASFSLGMNDGQGWCECPACKASDRPIPDWHGFSGDKSVLYYTWMNKVAANLERDYPRQKLGCLAYSSAILPPPFKLHPSIIPYFTSNRADYFDPNFRAQDEEMLARWSRCTTQMGIYDYAYGAGFAVPRIYNHLFQEAIQFAAAHKVTGFYAEVYPNWGLDGPKLWVMSRILWDPQVNVDRLSAEWNQRMFRTAAAPMRRYFALAEKAWREQHTGAGHWAYRLAGDPRQFEIFTPAIMKQMTACLDEADKLAQEDIVRQRLRFFRKTWEVTLLLAGNYWAGREVQALTDKNAPVEQVAQAMRRMTEQVATTDVDAYIKQRIGADPIAYYPSLPGWFAPLKAGATGNVMRYFAAAIANEAVAQARRDGKVDGATIRANINQRTAAIFGNDGSENYRKTVARLREMATKVGAAARVQTPPTMDGSLADPIWQKSDVLSDFILWGGASAAQYQTKVRLCHDGRNLYVGLECFQNTSKLVCQSAPRDGSTWKDDSVEIFVNRGMEATPFAQFILNASGAFFDQYDRTGQQSYAERLSYNFDASWAAQVYPDRWTGEVRIPLKELGIDPAQQQLVRVNFVRNVQLAPGEISAWFSSLRAHADPLSRGWIILE